MLIFSSKNYSQSNYTIAYNSALDIQANFQSRVILSIYNYTTTSQAKYTIIKKKQLIFNKNNLENNILYIPYKSKVN